MMVTALIHCVTCASNLERLNLRLGGLSIQVPPSPQSMRTPTIPSLDLLESPHMSHLWKGREMFGRHCRRTSDCTCHKCRRTWNESDPCHAARKRFNLGDQTCAAFGRGDEYRFCDPGVQKRILKAVRQTVEEQEGGDGMSDQPGTVGDNVKYRYSDYSPKVELPTMCCSDVPPDGYATE